ncbi:MAG: hypothetical protein IJB08_02240 [Alistipes sp.]|nr:hypothetical protein [Alistipes sp.]
MGVILCSIVIQNRGADEGAKALKLEVDEGVKALKLEVDEGVKALKLEADGGCERWSMTLESCEIGMLSDGNVN